MRYFRIVAFVFVMLLAGVAFASDSGDDNDGEDDACFVVATIEQAQLAGLRCDVDDYPHLDPANAHFKTGTPFTAEEIEATREVQLDPHGE